MIWSLVLSWLVTVALVGVILFVVGWLAQSFD
jgi:hypothetical protein